MPRNATVEAHATKPPILLEGDCTQATLRQFEIAFQNYCTLKTVEPKGETAIVVGCFRDYRITDWLQIEEERTKVLAMSFKEFMVELRKKMLPLDWERAARLSMLARRQSASETFDDFATNVRSQNSLLSGTSSHLADDRLRLQLESAMLPELLEDYETDAVAKHKTDFNEWLTGVRRIDATRIRSNARYQRLAAEDRKRIKAFIVAYYQV
jgi:hypothetical protein